MDKPLFNLIILKEAECFITSLMRWHKWNTTL